jgi:hypothetical protein
VYVAVKVDGLTDVPAVHAPPFTLISGVYVTTVDPYAAVPSDQLILIELQERTVATTEKPAGMEGVVGVGVAVGVKVLVGVLVGGHTQSASPGQAAF